MKNFMKEFREFISRGNVMDMAVGIIIGSAFTAIVTSLVDDVFMPLIGILIGGIDFSSLSITVGGAVLKYGIFIQNVLNFLLIAFCVFLLIRGINRMRTRIEEKIKSKKDEPPAEEDPADIALLKEIRDLLKEKSA